MQADRFKAMGTVAQHVGVKNDPPTIVVTYQRNGRLRMRSIKVSGLLSQQPDVTVAASAVLKALPCSLRLDQVCRMLQSLQADQPGQQAQDEAGADFNKVCRSVAKCFVFPKY